LRETVAIDAHLRYLEQLTENADWTAASRAQVVAAMQRIRDRERDPRLFLGVVGEFSSGKSTLINALIGDELLRTDVVQATTSAATVLSYGSELAVEVVYRNGSRQLYPQQELASGSAVLHQVTAEEEVARGVAQVNIYHPSEKLKDGLVIVDTPGANVDNERHAQVTRTVLRDLCDAAIVVVPAEAAVSQSLVSFLRRHLADVLHHCLFVVTKFDLIRKTRERRPLLENIRCRLGRELNLDHVVVLPAAPQLVLDALRGGPGDSSPSDRLSAEDRQELLQQSRVTEEALRGMLREQNLQIQLERVSLLLTRLLKQLRRVLGEGVERYRARQEEFERKRLPDLAGFIGQQKAHYLEALRCDTTGAVDALTQGVGAVRKQVLGKLRQAITRAGNKEVLQAVAQLHVPAMIDLAQGQLQQQLDERVLSIEEAGNRQHQAFQESFGRIYDSLALMVGKVTLPREKLGKPVGQTILQNVNRQVLQAAGSVTSNPLTQLKEALGLGPTLAQAQAQCWQHLRAGLTEYFTLYERSAVAQVQAAIAEAEAILQDQIERYGQKYDQLVQDMARCQQAEAIRLEGLRKRIEANLREVGSRYDSLAQVLPRLRGLHQPAGT
jgi:ribosome biogenesis GTPase A